MSQPNTIESLEKQPLLPRPSPRTDQRSRNYSSFNFGILAQRAKTAKKLDPVFRLSIPHRNSFQDKKQYLYVRMMRKNHNLTPQFVSAKKVEQKEKNQENNAQNHCFIRTRKPKGRITSRTDCFRPTEKEATRPSTSQSSHTGQKLSYFDDFCVGHEALRSYKMMSHIGKGAFSVVSLAIGKEDNSSYAIKTYEKLQSLDWTRLSSIKRQIRHLKQLSHDRVVRLIDVVKQRKKLYLILENGGKHSLCGELRKNKILSEEKCKKYMKQILEGISYCHENGVCHRDLKPENILIDESGHIKIIDFGFSAHSRVMLTTYCGTPAYMAPEIIKKQSYIGSKADVWALGVMLYLMMIGTLPFRAPNEQELNRLITVGKYRYRDESMIPPGPKRLITKMLQVNPETRSSAQHLLEDNWFN